MELTDLSLWTPQVSRSHLYRRGAKSKRRQYATCIGDPTRGDYRHFHGVNHLWHQRHGPDLRRNILRQKHSPMPARLKTLGDNCVASLILKPTCLIHGSGSGQDRCTGTPDAVEKLLFRETEMKADHLRMKLHHEIAHLFVKGAAGGAGNGTIVISL